MQIKSLLCIMLFSFSNEVNRVKRLIHSPAMHLCTLTCEKNTERKTGCFFNPSRQNLSDTNQPNISLTVMRLLS